MIETAEVIYLVSSAGRPNYGDELITRAWLDALTELRPRAEVWLDCPHPGRASHLFRRTHPNLHVTSTLWELARTGVAATPSDDMERIRRRVRDLGTPHIDFGLLALRGVTSIHLIGTAHFDDQRPADFGVIAAVAELQREFGIPAWATGLRLGSLSVETTEWVREQLAEFDHVESRDRITAEIAGADLGVDDAFLALAVSRSVYDQGSAPESMCLVQGDDRWWSDADAIRTIEAFLSQSPDGMAGFVEAVPPDDARYRADTCPGARFYSFGNVWFDGLPAHPEQRWLTTRPHMHLLAAAAGAAGTVIVDHRLANSPDHGALLELGTGWTAVSAGAFAEPTSDPDFPMRASEYAASKWRLAELLYPAAQPSD